MSSADIVSEADGNQVDYHSRYFEDFSRNQDWRFRSLTGEGGYVVAAYATESLANGRVEHPERFQDFWDDSLTKAMVELHDLFSGDDSVEAHSHGPNVIFLTATRAIPYGFAIKQFWQEAYPDELQPRFHVVDSSSRRFGMNTTLEEEDAITERETDRLRMVGEKYGFERTAIFDEFKNGGRTINTAKSIVESAGFSEPHLLLGHWGDGLSISTITDDELPIFRHEDVGQTYRELMWNAGVRSRALIADMKQVGHHMALEARRRKLVA